ncbi:MAG: tRNA uridine-5-carboxymethylaminomethyl(34) synthesis enzyme MnmG [Candidatus Omnitrophica bacterium]|nr:tRNA uridine-5-carboxymethylaminomethyl(34) synthesis enzyme MnmG [Candidatus Omnitrophota bacterium]
MKYAAIVVGAGHAGIEASLAIARAGFETLLLTLRFDAIGRMSCNPAIGGVAKGHMVREIDALGGEMALTTDATALQFRMLNRSKGPAVWAPRAQADKLDYHRVMAGKLRGQKNLELKEAEVTELLAQEGRAVGVRTKTGEEFFAEHVVITTGTFMQGLIHVGDVNYPGGRRDEAPSVGLSDSLKKLGLDVVRFKTGTPPRLDARTIHWEILEPQFGDDPPEPFSFRTEKLEVEQLPCFLTHTNQETHRIVRENLHLSPLYAGRIVGIGPRYCPSLEDKVVKFHDKERHQIYLEPEGRSTTEIYVNGLSMSLPIEVQEKIVHSMRGLEEAKFIRWAYAIEYDCLPPTQLKHSLETKQVENLFLAGQVNCTSGYEEAAAQGLMAGLNVVRKLRGGAPFILGRTEAYIGVLVDDLVTRGTNEPYRMFTSRAEFRLLLRQDNADERLMKYGFEFGLVPEAAYEKSKTKYQRVRSEILRLRRTRHQNTTLEQWLRRPENHYREMLNLRLGNGPLSEEEIRHVEFNIKYEGYISRQVAEAKALKHLERRRIPETLHYEKILGLSREAREKLSKVRPRSIGQASRIPGISPCDLSLLSVYLEKLSRVSG